MRRAGVDAPDFYARVEFDNPTPRQDLWDVGLGFRDSGEDEQFRLIVDSDGTWFFKNALDAVIATGTLVDIDRSATGSNIIEVVAAGDTGYFAFNERLSESSSICPAGPKGGDVFVGAGFFDADAVEDATTPLPRFRGLAAGRRESGSHPMRLPAQLDVVAFDQLVQVRRKPPSSGRACIGRPATANRHSHRASGRCRR